MNTGDNKASHSTIEIYGKAVALIVNSNDIPSLIYDETVQVFLFKLGFYQFKNIGEIERLLINIHNSSFRLNEKDELYRINLLDLIVEQIRKININKEPVKSDFNGLIQVFEGSKYLLRNKTQSAIAEALDVKNARISEWKKGKRVPGYIEKSIQRLLDIPVWCFTY